ncbi:TIGR02444 family protein [Stutzerimonas nosocomialis]|uniref:TIGR02444 family protein n=1 Tax=Stutzerimonas nosocomialis TaxID=1056496 RepID=UPI001109C99B|nr:TIGR02444 family protein [Stutzerimonas nosocomialis]TLX58736.1 TIGR02444 family protein [Stutzerimonas nosocomialis]
MNAPDLWSFALDCYARPGVETACLALQDQGADVCLVLTGAWLETRRVACTPERLATLQALAGHWQALAIEPLRSTRRHWKEPGLTDPSLEALRRELKRLELAAERVLLERLQNATADWAAQRDAEPWLEALLGEGCADQTQRLRLAAGQAQLSAG